jgi:hypothetical protein
LRPPPILIGIQVSTVLLQVTIGMDHPFQFIPIVDSIGNPLVDEEMDHFQFQIRVIVNPLLVKIENLPCS